jgi:hypothetical protein
MKQLFLVPTAWMFRMIGSVPIRFPLLRVFGYQW